MTPAERAQYINEVEFALECKDARERALRFAEDRQIAERRRLKSILGRGDTDPSLKQPSPGYAATLYECDGQSKTISEWSKVSGLPVSTLYTRLKAGMPIKLALTMKRGYRAAKFHEINGVAKTMPQWADYAGITYEALSGRMRAGRSLAEAVAKSRPLPSPEDRGVVSNHEPFEGTGAGSTAQNIPNITFSQEPAE